LLLISYTNLRLVLLYQSTITPKQARPLIH